MSKRHQRQPPPAPRPARPWPVYILIAVAAFASGSAVTMWLRPNEPAHLASPSAANAASTLADHAAPPNGGPLEIGNWYYDHQRWSEAIAQFERAISQGIANPDIRTDLGNAYRFAGNPQKALELYQQAQRQNPQHEQSLFNQGALYAQNLGDPITGAAKWREFISRFPPSATAADARRMLADFEKQFGTVMSNTPSPAR